MTSGTIVWDKSTVMILFNATFSMHKSTLSTNDFGINHFGQSTVVILIIATFLKHKSTLSTKDFGNNHFGQKYKSDFNYCDNFIA